ncbi:hypothetical protein ARMGADRAFT_1161569 [Armillaria gallica]|uniref:Uncharacterized protein n=1 Tax=Armillaria gallica TaxID=47427 RepID=A0A2H3DXT8_ARMGA|nr:hypothetical protein ARMGADRAFT_1161569 [Armillaria gallica]
MATESVFCASYISLSRYSNVDQVTAAKNWRLGRPGKVNWHQSQRDYIRPPPFLKARTHRFPHRHHWLDLTTDHRRGAKDRENEGPLRLRPDLRLRTNSSQTNNVHCPARTIYNHSSNGNATGAELIRRLSAGPRQPDGIMESGVTGPFRSHLPGLDPPSRKIAGLSNGGYPPEMPVDDPYCPFKADVSYLGRMLMHTDSWRIDVDVGTHDDRLNDVVESWTATATATVGHGVVLSDYLDIQRCW